MTLATLRVYANSASSGGYDIRSVSDNTWNESTVTYNNAPAFGGVLGSSGAVSSGVWTSVNVTAYITGNGSYNLALTVPGATAISFASRESGANAPQLVIETSGGSVATSTPTQAPLATPTATQVPLATPTATKAPLATPTATAGAGSLVTFVPSADSYVNSGSPDTNYGLLTTLRGDGSPIVNSYLRFNVQGLSGAVTHATLRVFANSSSSSGGYDIRGVSNNTWVESTITYNNAPAVGSVLGTFGNFSSGVWTSVDVTAYITGNATYNLALTVPGSQAISFASRESGANAPQLVVQTGSGSVATPTATPVSNPTATPNATSTPTQIVTAMPTATNTATPGPSNTPSASTIQHVFVVVMENHSYNEVWNTSSSPYITSLGNAYARATNYHAKIHPSLPNYLDLYGGSNYGITTDCNPSTTCHVNATNLADNLDAKGLTWKGYMESMPSPCYLTTSGTYAPKHNPMVYFDDIRLNAARCSSHDVPFTALATDLASASTTPNYSLIVPNLCNDMHDCSVTTGDNWLKAHLPAILI